VIALFVVGASAAWGALPLPSYRDELARERAAMVDKLLTDNCTWERLLAAMVCAPGAVDAAVAEVDAFERVLFRDAGLEYLAGLAYNYAGDDVRARRRYEAALELDPDRTEAWYDLGELHLSAGRLDEAEHAFTEVAKRKTTGENAWVGEWRLAEVAAFRHDPVAFESHIVTALERGFTFRHVMGLPNWRTFYADPALRDTLDKLLTVYADPDVKESLQAAPPPSQ
jgi:tetratricopeptide (TPR) repeat protein